MPHEAAVSPVNGGEQEGGYHRQRAIYRGTQRFVRDGTGKNQQQQSDGRCNDDRAVAVPSVSHHNGEHTDRDDEQQHRRMPVAAGQCRNERRAEDQEWQREAVQQAQA